MKRPGHDAEPLTRQEAAALETVEAALAKVPAPEPLNSEPSAVTRLNVGNTYHCNMGCTYCYNELDLKDRKGSEVPTGMSRETALATVDALMAQSGDEPRLSLMFVGGEPLLERKVLWETVAYARAEAAARGKQMEFTVYTNGTLMNRAALRWADENNVSLVVSLDGPPVLNARRIYLSGAPTSKAVLRNIQRLVSESSQEMLRVRAVAGPEADLTALHQYFFDLGFNEIHVQPAYDENGIKTVAEDQSLHLLSWYRERLLQGDVVSVMPFEGFLEKMMWRGKAVGSWYPCSAGRTALGVGPDGKVYPCHHFLEEGAFELGDVRKGLPILEVRRPYFKRVDEREPCGSCWARHICGGECYHRAHASGAGYTGVLPRTCRTRKSLIGLTIEMFAELAVSRPDILRRVVVKDYCRPEPQAGTYELQDLSRYLKAPK
ncbi:radical SAM protein [Streptomyces bauhiniae]